MMSTVDVSAQCKSSRKRSSGASVEISRRNAANSRFIRSCETAGDSVIMRSTDASSDIASCTSQDGATVFITRPTDGLPRIKLSSASRNGRYASAPARRSEQRPRAIRQAGCSDRSSARKSSTNVVLPRPASPVTQSTRPCPAVADRKAVRSCARSVDRPTVFRAVSAVDDFVTT